MISEAILALADAIMAEAQIIAESIITS
jgi:hypothetical protein